MIKRVASEIMIVHPGKHHVLHLVAGCVKSGLDVSFITPLYKLGAGNLLSFVPGTIGKKASGYYHPGIPKRSIVSPLQWQLQKIKSFFNSNSNYVRIFDSSVASCIQNGRFKAKILVTLQDYLPKTVYAAKKCGFQIWSDQIINQSAEMAKRIASHECHEGVVSRWNHDENVNTELLLMSDFVTVPSTYCLDGIRERIHKSSVLRQIPYGAKESAVISRISRDTQRVTILARAPSIRKGGHLLLRAIKQSGEKMLSTANGNEIKIVILGSLEHELATMLKQMELPAGLTVVHGDVAHSDVARLYQQASLFVMPSLSEGRSLACVEAMHAELPLIITKYCGLDGFVSGEMGYEVEDTAESLATALLCALNNRHLWGYWGLNAKNLAKLLTWDIYEREIANLCKEIHS